MSGTCSKIHFSPIAISRERDWLTDISWRYIKFDLTFLIGNLISNIFCSMHFFDKIHCLWDNEVFWVFQLFFWNGNKTFLVEDTLNLIAHSRKEIRFCISFIRDTFLIWLTVYEIMRGKKKTSLSRKRQPKVKILISSISLVHYHVMHCVIHNRPSRSLFSVDYESECWLMIFWKILSLIPEANFIVFPNIPLGTQFRAKMWKSEITFRKFSTRTNL